jgi:hypothetical protein
MGHAPAAVVKSDVAPQDVTAVGEAAVVSRLGLNPAFGRFSPAE